MRCLIRSCGNGGSSRVGFWCFALITLISTLTKLPASIGFITPHHYRNRFTSIVRRANTAVETMTSSEDPLKAAGLPSPLLLGSASFTRKLILSEMGIPYCKVVRPIDEKEWGDRSRDDPATLVLHLAQAKMDHLVQEIMAGRCRDDLPPVLDAVATGTATESREWIVLTGDQVVTCQGTILEKPESVTEAEQFVAMYASSPPSTVGSCVLRHLPSGRQVSGVDTATIYFRPTIAAANLIQQLVAEDAPVMSCAGGLMIEHPLVREHLDRIDGTEDSVMGLSKDLVRRLISELAEAMATSKGSPLPLT